MLSAAISIFRLVGVGAFAVAVILTALASQFLEAALDVRTLQFAICILGAHAAIAFRVMAFNGFFGDRPGIRCGIRDCLGEAIAEERGPRTASPP